MTDESTDPAPEPRPKRKQKGWQKKKVAGGPGTQAGTRNHIPGSAAPKQFPKSGSEEEFWRRCEEAATLRARSMMPYPEIAARFGVRPGMAHQMVSRYLRGAARFYPAIELRELLALRYREQYRLTMRELARLENDNDATYKRLACISKAESLITKEAELFGLGGNDINIYMRGTEEAHTRPLPSLEDQRKLRALAREMRAVQDAHAVEAKYTVQENEPASSEDSESGENTENGDSGGSKSEEL